MLFHFLLGVAIVIGVTIVVTSFVLELMRMPVMSDEEWDIEMAKRPPYWPDSPNTQVIPEAHLPVEPPAEAD